MSKHFKDNVARAVLKEWLVNVYPRLEHALGHVVDAMAKTAMNECEKELALQFCEPEVTRVMDLMACTLYPIRTFLDEILNGDFQPCYSRSFIDQARKHAERIDQVLDSYNNLQKILVHTDDQATIVLATIGGAS